MLPSTASAKRVSRFGGFCLLSLILCAVAMPTVYVWRAPMARANDDSQPSASVSPASQAPSQPTTQAPSQSASQPTPAATTELEERITTEQVQLEPGKVITIERHTGKSGETVRVVGGGPKAAKTGAKAVEFFPEPSTQEKQILTMLTEPVTVEITSMLLTDAAEYLQDLLSIDIHVDASAYEETDAGSKTVKVSAKDRPLRSVLRHILPSAELTYFVDDDALQIMSAEKAKSTLITRTYPVADLLESPLLARPLAAATYERATAAAPLGGAEDPKAAPKRHATSNPTSTYERLRDTITNTVAPESWDEVGGSGSISIVPEARSLVISQTHAAHDEVLKLLRALRGARALADQQAAQAEPLLQAPRAVLPTQHAPTANSVPVVQPYRSPPLATPSLAPSADPFGAERKAQP